MPEPFFDLYPLEDVRLPEPGNWREGLPEAGQRMGAERREWHRWIEANGEWPQAVQGYLASISFADAQVGRLLDALEASGRADETIIVLWSDHGFHLGERETWEKFTLWEESTPGAVLRRGAGSGGAGGAVGTRGRPAGHLSHARGADPACPRRPTSSKAAAWCRGSAIRGAPATAPAISTFASGQHTVRTDRWRYIRYRDGSGELYDHAHDPEERVNLVADPMYADTVAALARWLEPILEAEAVRGGGGAGDDGWAGGGFAATCAG